MCLYLEMGWSDRPLKRIRSAQCECVGRDFRLPYKHKWMYRTGDGFTCHKVWEPETCVECAMTHAAATACYRMLERRVIKAAGHIVF